MAGRIPQSFIDELTARADIVVLIGSRVELKKAGREYRACCPFHNEKTPSFWVSPQKQFYHCFGCGVHGTALGFLMEYDKLSFPEAIEELAGRLGLDVPREASSQPDNSGSTQPLYDMNLKVAKYFASVLPGDARAREYARKRCLTRETIETFLIGFATNSWNELIKRFGSTESDRKVLSDCGLIIERERTDSRTLDRHYDRFRDRLMFPIRDSRGRVLAYSDRIIEQGEPVPQLPRYPAVPQGTRAVRSVRGATKPGDAQTADGGRGLYGCRAPAPGRNQLCRGHTRNGHDARA